MVTSSGKRNKELAALESAVAKAMTIVKTLRRMELVPMTYILGKVPGATVVEKAESVGVSRQTFYYWMQGRSRPSLPQAERLAGITGIPVSDIRTNEN